MLHIYVDADACPVKLEVYRVAQRYNLEVTLVANSRMKVPFYPWLKLVVVNDQFDAADNWIVEHCGKDDIVITADILLADRCIKNGALVLGATGKEFTEDTIGGAVAMRDLMSELRESGLVGGGVAPFQPKDRSRFLQNLDQMIQRVKNRNK
ncbi:MAG: YaiI/YqxD family protein [Fibrobacterota bacterium]